MDPLEQLLSINPKSRLAIKIKRRIGKQTATRHARASWAFDILILTYVSEISNVRRRVSLPVEDMDSLSESQSKRCVRTAFCDPSLHTLPSNSLDDS